MNQVWTRIAPPAPPMHTKEAAPPPAPPTFSLDLSSRDVEVTLSDHPGIRNLPPHPPESRIPDPWPLTPSPPPPRPHLLLHPLVLLLLLLVKQGEELLLGLLVELA